MEGIVAPPAVGAAYPSGTGITRREQRETAVIGNPLDIPERGLYCDLLCKNLMSPRAGREVARLEDAFQRLGLKDVEQPAK